MYCRVEVREGRLVSFGHPSQQSPVIIDASTEVRIETPEPTLSRVLTVTHPAGGRIPSQS